jgi:multiple sugar transport system permease protein
MALQAWRHMSPRARREARAGYLGILPWVIGFVLFTAGPLVISFFLSFTQWDIVRPPQWVGLANYIRMFTEDQLFRISLGVTFSYVLMSVPLQLVVGLALALLLNVKVRGMNIFRTVFYLPAVLSGVAVSLMWIWILHPDLGVVNGLLGIIGVQGPGWFWDAHWALPSVVLMKLWAVGEGAVIYLAGLQNIPPHLYEAASIDGASRWRQFWSITLPLLTPTLFFQLIIIMIDAFRVFTEAYVITKGGPLNATYFYMLYLYEEAFQNFNMGYASALGWVLTIITATASFVLFRTSNRWVYYEDSEERAT